MRLRIILLIALILSSRHALEKGKKYDFRQKNGQTIRNAELLEENPTEYVVKLQYLNKPLRIAKATIAQQPSKSEPENQQVPLIQWSREIRVQVLGGYSALTFGPLRDIFPAGFHAGLGADWHLFRQPVLALEALSVLGIFSQHSQDIRFLRQIGFHAGPKVHLGYWMAPGIRFSTRLMPGMAAVALKGYNFAADYLAFSALATLQAERQIGPLWVSAQFFANYLYDPAVSFVATGFGLSVCYAFAAGK